MSVTTDPGARWRVGLLLPGVPSDEQTVASIVGLADEAEEAGYDSVWVGDHLQWNMPFLDPLAMLGALAGRTSRVRLGSAVLLASVRHPVPLAKSLLTVDHISGGRLSVGLGGGTDRGGDFRAVGIDPRRRGALMDSAVPALRRLLDGEHVRIEGGWQGEATPSPGPCRERIPLYLGGHSEAALRRAARYGDGWIAAFTDADALRIGVAKLGQECERAGRDPATCHVLLVTYVRLADTSADALELVAPYFRQFYGMRADQAARRSAFGPLEQVQERLAEFREAGVSEIIVGHPGFDDVPAGELLGAATLGPRPT